jgi:hypothetical protein
LFKKQNDTLYLPTYLPTNQPNKTNPTTHNQTQPNPASQPTNQPRLGNRTAYHTLQITDVKLNSSSFIVVELPVPKHLVGQECTNLLPVYKFQVPHG